MQTKPKNILESLYKYKYLTFVGVFVFVGLLAFGSLAGKASADTQGPYSTTNGYTNIVGCGDNGDWSDINQASGSDDAYASSSLKSDWCSYFLYLDGFGFNIPAGATIDGIEVGIERRAEFAGDLVEQYVSMLDAGSPVGSNYADSNYWQDYDDTVYYGSSSDLWGNSWSPGMINDTGFGIILYALAGTEGSDAFIDDVFITVHYTPASNTCQSISSGSGNWNSAGTWTNCGGGVPGSADTAIINGTANITVTASTTVASLNFGTTAAAATNATLTINSSQTLTVTGVTTMTGTAGTATQGTVTGSGTLTTTYLYIGAAVTPSSTVTNKLISTITALNVTGYVTLNGYSNGGSYNNPAFEIQSGTADIWGINTTLAHASNTATISLQTGAQSGTLKMSTSSPWVISGTGTTTTSLNGTTSTVEYSGLNQTFLNTTYKGLKVSGNAGTTAQNVTVSGVLNVTGTLSPSSGTIVLSGTGTPLTVSGTFNPSTTSVVQYTGSTATVTATTFNTLTVGGTGTYTFPASGWTIKRNLTITSGATVTKGAGTITFNTAGQNCTITGNATNSDLGTISIGNGSEAKSCGLGSSVKFTAVTITTGAGLDMVSSYTMTLTGSGTPLTATGAFTKATGTVEYTSASGVTALSSVAMTSSKSYYNLIINGSGTFSMGSAFDVANDLTVTSGTLSSSASTTTNGVVSVTGTMTYAGSSTFTHSTTSSKNFGGNGNLSFYALTFSGGGGTTVATGSGTVTVTNVLTNSHAFNAGSKTWILTGSGTPFSGGIDTPGTSTFSYRSTTGATVNSNITYNNLDISPASGTNPTFLVNATNKTINGNLTVSGVSGTSLNYNNIVSYLILGGNLTINAGNTLVAPPSGATFTIAGSLANSGTFTHNSGNITFSSTSTGRTIATNGSSLNNVIFNGAGGGWSPSGGAMTLAGDLTMTAGTLSGSQNVTVNGGDVTGNGTINMSSGTFLVDGTSGTGFGGSTNWTFSALTFGDGSGSTTISSTGSGSITTSTLTIAASQTYNAGAKTYVLSGTGTPLTVTGTFNSESSTVQHTGATATVRATTYYTLHLGISSGTYTMPSTTITIKGNLVIPSGVTVTKGAGTIVFSGTGNQLITDSNDTKQDLGAVQISNTADNWCSAGQCNYNWLSRRKITFNNSDLSGNLTNFPVLVSLTGLTIDYAKTKNSGEDIRFVDPDGTVLNHEIEKWDESGTSLVWVKIPTLSNNATDYVYMYYNNPQAVDIQAPTNVWDSNYKAIYHLPNGTTLRALDSTGVNNANITSATATTGKVGGGASFNGTSAKIIAPATSSLDVSSGAGITVDGWFNPTDMTGMRPLIEWGNSGAYGVHMWNYPSSGKIYVNVVESNGANHTFQTTGTPLTLSTWQHVAFTYNKSTGAVALYYNGVAQSLDTGNIGAFTPKTNLDFNIGHRPNTGGVYYYNGSQDEIRVSNVVRTADWMKASYNSSNSSMNSFGSEEVYGGTSVAMGSPLKMTSLTIDSGRTFGVNGSNTLTLTGNGASVFVVSGNFIASTGTVEYVSTATTGTTVASTTYYNLVVNRASNTFTMPGEMYVNNNFTISAGNFSITAESLILGGDFTNNGTFTPNEGSVVMQPLNSTKTSQILGSSNTSLGYFQAMTPGSTIKFQAGRTYTWLELTVVGSEAEPVTFSSTSAGSQWNVTLTDTNYIQYLRVKDSACVGDTYTFPRDNPDLYNLGNNGTCWGFIVQVDPGGPSGGGSGSSGASSSTSQIFTTSGTWTAPVGITSVDVEVWGGGAGGSYYGGGGGGGGAYSRKNSITVTPFSTYTVTVGAGGNEAVGGDSWFLSTGTVLAKGGSLGVYGFGGGGPPCTGGTGGATAAGVGDVKYAGGNGGTGQCYGGTGGGGGAGASSTANGANGSGTTAGASSGQGGRGGTGSGFDISPPAGSWGEAIGGGGGGWTWYEPSIHPRGARGEVRIYYNGAGGGSGGSGSSGGSGGSGGGSSCTTTATGTVDMENDRVAGVTIVCGGSGYSSAPTVTFIGGGGSGASATAVLTNGVVTSVTINSGGEGYDLPSVTFSAPGQGGGGGGASP
ncbi:DUF2341 domain-containing protein [bacterium]|nr:MAG: DUF2341 domain-containing protein [bacterium]